MPTRSMSAILTASVVTVLLAACVAPGRFNASSSISKECPNGSAKAVIEYSDSYVKVTSKVKLKRNSALKFVLKPKKGKSVDKNGVSKDNKDLNVTITGVKYIPADGATGDNALTWLNKTGNVGTGKKEVIACTKVDQAEGTYYYSVDVENVGTLDPRADVEK